MCLISGYQRYMGNILCAFNNDGGSYTVQHHAFLISQLYISTNEQSVKMLHRQFCPSVSAYVCHLQGIMNQITCTIFCKTIVGTQFGMRYYFGENCTVKFFFFNYVHILGGYCTVVHWFFFFVEIFNQYQMATSLVFLFC
jgi:hypothetical protein